MKIQQAIEECYACDGTGERPKGAYGMVICPVCNGAKFVYITPEIVPKRKKVKNRD